MTTATAIGVNDNNDIYSNNNVSSSTKFEDVSISHDDNNQLLRQLSNISKDHRWRVEHAQNVNPADIPRFAKSKIIASMQGIHCTSDAPYVAKRIGEKRAATEAYMWRDFMKAGVLVNNGTDVPVENIDPFANFYSSVTRKLSDGSSFYDGQKMTREEAIYSYTLANFDDYY
jgi:predicted amidohydrolase YtcJ